MAIRDLVSSEEDRNFDFASIDVGLVAHTITKALDYVGLEDQSHGRRVGLICYRVGQYLGWNKERCFYALLAGMLHDIGVSSTDRRCQASQDLVWNGHHFHCTRGSAFLEGFPHFKGYSISILYHHTGWDSLPESLCFETKQYANLIFLADRMDVLYSHFQKSNAEHQVLVQKNLFLDQLSPHMGSIFSPELFNALSQITQHDCFWIELQEHYLDDVIYEVLSENNSRVKVSFAEVEAMGELISKIVDTKSQFTHDHSLRVSELAYVMANILGYDLYTIRTLRLAGLLHDVGKLRTPDHLLEKPGALTDEEFAQIRPHPMDSKRVLSWLFPNTSIAKWASGHHEKLDGSGYPFGLSGDQIDGPTRVLTLCDIFQALCQKRPYRDQLELDGVFAIMDKMVENKQLDADIYQLMKANGSQLYQIATGESNYNTVDDFLLP